LEVAAKAGPARKRSASRTSWKNPMLKVTNLRKVFNTVVAVDNVSLEVRRGELFGLLGPNGAGKTTTIRTVLNIIQPDSGTITFDGKPFTPEMWNTIGYLPEERGLYRKSKIISTVMYFASLKGLPAAHAKLLAYYWLERFGLKDEAYRRVEELSKGNQQKVQLAISILHSPQLLILDEPFSSLDPVNQALLKDILLELRQKNIAIIFSTHQMDRVEKMCDTICLINKGRPVLSGELYAIKNQYGTDSIRLEYEGNGEFLKSLGFVRRADVYQNYAELELNDLSKKAELLSIANDRLSLRKFEIVEPSLNSIFINAVGGPEKIDQAGEKPIPESGQKTVRSGRGVMQDRRVRSAAFSSLLMAGMLIIFTLKNIDNSRPEWVIPLIALAALALSVAQFFARKRKVEEELARTQSPEGERR
jgi:ABC-2 type transport system ATP-binding protein